MASSKDTFEPKTFAARTFAVGAFRGVGVDVETKQLRIAAQDTFQGGAKASSWYQGGAEVNQ